jgi:hypothetical protein
MDSSIANSLIALVGVVSTAAFTYMGVRLKFGKAQLKQAEQEIDFQRTALGFSEFIAEWASISKEMELLIETTSIDRVLIFRAWNGSMSPRYTTAVYQLREGGQDPISYIHVELDQDYQDKIRQIVGRKNLYFEVDKIEDSAIKAIYLVEGVTASYWAYLHSFSLKGSKSKAVIYMSFATHSNQMIDEATKTRCNLLVSRLRGIAEDMHTKDESIVVTR